MKKLIIFLIVLLTPTICSAKTHETRWSPDTCGCVIVYEWDDEIPVDQIVTTFKRAESVCEAHKNAPEDKFVVVLEENQRKNNVFSESKKINPDLKPDDFNYRFDENRKLIVSATGIEKSHESALEAKVGGDKVDVE